MKIQIKKVLMRRDNLKFQRSNKKMIAKLVEVRWICKTRMILVIKMKMVTTPMTPQI